MAKSLFTDTGKVTTTPKYNTPEKVAAAMKAAGSKLSTSASGGTVATPTKSTSPPTQTQTPSTSTPVQNVGTPAQAYYPQGGVAYNAAYPSSGWSNVWRVFTAPWKGDSISILGKNIPIISPALSAVTGIAEVGSLAYGAALAYGGTGATVAATGASGSGATSTATALAKSGSLRNLGLAAGAGAIAGALLTGRTSQELATDQTQTPSASNTNYQITSTTDNSIRQQRSDQYTYNTISGSPYSSIGGSPSMTAQQPTTNAAYPSLSAPLEQYAGQTSSPTQAAGESLLIPALIVGAAFILSR